MISESALPSLSPGRAATGLKEKYVISLSIISEIKYFLFDFRQGDLIGELEFCFICFLVGHSLEAFEQWKKLINMFCSSELAITKYRRIYHQLLNVLKLHVSEIPEEFLADIVANNNFFYIKMRDLFRNIGNSNADGELKTRADRFKEFLTEKFTWSFDHLDSEDDDDAPVIVDIDIKD